jgi:hypothetical protein
MVSIVVPQQWMQFEINLANQLQVFFEEYKLINKIIYYVKDEDTNLSTRQIFLNKLLFVKNCRY